MAKTPPPVQDLTPTPALDIDSSDVALPKLYVAHYLTKAVQDGLVVAGQIFSASGPADPDPVVLYDGKPDSEGVLIHVLSLTKGRSAKVGDDLKIFAFDDPDAPADSWITYNYVVVVPEFDADVPHKLLLARSGTSAARTINTVLKKNEARGPAYLAAFRISTAKQENDKGRWFTPLVRVVEAKAEHVALVSGLADLVCAAPAQISPPRSDEPSI